MWEEFRCRIEGIAKRAGLAGVPWQAVVVACLVCVAMLVWAAWRWWPSEDPAPVVVRSPKATDADTRHAVQAASEATRPAELVVHIAGAVRRPGVYRVAQGSRVSDAVDCAGGVLPDAVTAAVNLARPLADGEQVIVPTEDDLQAVTGAAGAAGTGGDLGTSAAPAKVDVNTADAAALDTLPGVGPSTAAKIIAERESGGPFASVEDLGRVSGIGPKRLEALKDYISVR